MRGLLINPTGDPQLVDVDDTLDAYQQLVGGYIETVALDVGITGVGIINEEGKLNGLPRNDAATSCAYLHGGDWIAGPMLVMGPYTSAGDFTEPCDALIRACLRKAGLDDWLAEALAA